MPTLEPRYAEAATATALRTKVAVEEARRAAGVPLPPPLPKAAELRPLLDALGSIPRPVNLGGDSCAGTLDGVGYSGRSLHYHVTLEDGEAKWYAPGDIEERAAAASSQSPLAALTRKAKATREFAAEAANGCWTAASGGGKRTALVRGHISPEEAPVAAASKLCGNTDSGTSQAVELVVDDAPRSINPSRCSTICSSTRRRIRRAPQLKKRRQG